MRVTHEPAELSLLETLAAAPAGSIPEGYVEAAALALYAQGALTAAVDFEVGFDNGVPHCDELARALFTAYGRGLIGRSGSVWCLATAGRAALEEAGLEPTVEAKAIVAEALELPAAELLTEVSERLSPRYAMIASRDGQPVRI